MKKLSISLDGKSLEVLAMKMNGKVWFHHAGETFVHSPKSSSVVGAGAASSIDPTKILAPMPGKIIKIFAKPGQVVEEGETLVAMEAMKMEYNLKASQKMKIVKILCKEAETVSLGDQLVLLEESNV